MVKDMFAEVGVVGKTNHSLCATGATELYTTHTREGDTAMHWTSKFEGASNLWVTEDQELAVSRIWLCPGLWRQTPKLSRFVTSKSWTITSTATHFPQTTCYSRCVKCLRANHSLLISLPFWHYNCVFNVNFAQASTYINSISCWKQVWVQFSWRNG